MAHIALPEESPGLGFSKLSVATRKVWRMKLLALKVLRRAYNVEAALRASMYLHTEASRKAALSLLEVPVPSNLLLTQDHHRCVTAFAQCRESSAAEA
jgi:hypothetical protein